MRYKQDKDKIYLSINKEELVNASILKVCQENNFLFAWINGIGAIADPELGYFDVETKGYKKKLFKGHFELVSLIGNMTIKEEESFIHTHIAFTDKSYRAFGGHLFDCRIAAAGEFIITKGEKPLTRKYSKDIGLFLWDCEI